MNGSPVTDDWAPTQMCVGAQLLLSRKRGPPGGRRLAQGPVVWDARHAGALLAADHPLWSEVALVRTGRWPVGVKVVLIVSAASSRAGLQMPVWTMSGSC